MAYSFPRISFFIGLVLFGLIVTQSSLKQIPDIPTEPALKASIQMNYSENMCSGKYPSQIGVLLKQFPMINANILLIIALAGIFLAFLFNLIPQNNFFMWAFIHLITLVFVCVSFTAGYTFFLSPSTSCSHVKNMLVKANMTEINYMEIATNNKYVKQGLSFIPQPIMQKIHQYKDILLACFQKLGVSSPIFVIVIALYLINDKTRSVTRFEILSLVSFIVSVISGIGYFKLTNDVIFSIALPVSTIILILIVVNLALSFGYLFVAPCYMFACYTLSYRLYVTLIAFQIPFSFFIAAGFFVFLFINIFLWTKSGMYLTVVYMLNYGLSILYPFTADSLVCLLFILSFFTNDSCDASCCARKNKKQATEKVKQD
ncbi:Uncharacterized protein QTN25_008968 [Entamoeba marina]